MNEWYTFPEIWLNIEEGMIQHVRCSNDKQYRSLLSAKRELPPDVREMEMPIILNKIKKPRFHILYLNCLMT